MKREDALRALLGEAAAGGVAPRLDAAVWSDGELWGASSREGPAGIFDLASLTKPLATGSITMTLVGEGRLAIEDRVFDGATLRQVLDHSAGYAAWQPLFRVCLDDAEARHVFTASSDRPFARSRSLMEQAVAQTLPLAAPGAQTQYSDLGFLKLGLWIEQKLGVSLAELFQRQVARPLGLALGFAELSHGPRAGAEPTGGCRPRLPAPGQEGALAGLAFTALGQQPGEVDDDNAYALGGVAGHAGLFGTARDVARLGAAFLADQGGAGKLAPAEVVRAFCGPSGPGARGLSWDRPSAAGSSLGTTLGRGVRGAVGHLGFTGTSLWIDLDRAVCVALCSNRTLLGRENQLLRDFRPRFHEAVAQALRLA